MEKEKNVKLFYADLRVEIVRLLNEYELPGSVGSVYSIYNAVRAEVKKMLQWGKRCDK